MKEKNCLTEVKLMYCDCEVFSNRQFVYMTSVDEFDSTPLAQMHQLTTEKDEVEANSEVAKTSFLKYFSPSGRTYYLTPDETSAKFGNN